MLTTDVPPASEIYRFSDMERFPLLRVASVNLLFMQTVMCWKLTCLSIRLRGASFRTTETGGARPPVVRDDDAY